jgi:hypothetical protein
MTRESPVLKSVLLAVGSRPDVRAFRVNTGMGWAGDVTRLQDGSVLIRNPRPLRAGMVEGGSDIIGLQRVLITPAMVGRSIARFVAVETKGDTGRASDAQKRFLAMVTDFGGVAVVARSVADAQAALDGGLFG